MEKEFATYEQASALRDLGFNETCLGCYIYEVETLAWKLNYAMYDNDIRWVIAAPLKSQIFKWFRNKYDVDFYITRSLPNVISKDIYHIVLNDIWVPNDSHRNYEDAENRLIDNLIELAKQKK